MNKTGLILFHGFFEHKERHRLNAEWFENLGINTHLVDLPGHGEDAIEKGDLESWDEVNKTAEENDHKYIESLRELLDKYHVIGRDEEWKLGEEEGDD